MKFKYFDTEKIFEDAEKEGKFDLGENIFGYDTIGFNIRWIQPPQAAYFVSSVDKYGNVNSTPVTMGTAMWSFLPNGSWYYNFAVSKERHLAKNLKSVPECVISYIHKDLIKESWIAGLPIPRGINEVDIADLTPLPSNKVKPYGIEECNVNLEAKVVKDFELSPGGIMFICKIVGVSINKDKLMKDMSAKDQVGVLESDLLFEVLISPEKKNYPPRLCYSRMNLKKILRTQSDLGDRSHWIGTFKTWMESEKNRGRISEDEYKTLIMLNKKWQKNRDPEDNSEIKNKLTSLIQELVWRTGKGNKNK